MNEECRNIITSCYNTIRKYYDNIEKDNFVLQSNDVDLLPDLEKLSAIQVFIQENIIENQKYFNSSKYEILNLDENILKLSKGGHFNQDNFRNLIEKCKMLMQTQWDIRIYNEKLKQEIITLTNEKNLVIEKTIGVIDELKSNQLLLIEKIERITNEKDKITNERLFLSKKTDEIHRKAQENYMLKSEIEKTRSNNAREKNMIVINKDKEINSLAGRLKYAEKYEGNIVNERREKAKYINLTKELQVEVQKLKTENNKLLCELTQYERKNYHLNEKTTKLKDKCQEAFKTVNFLVNSEPFKDIRKMYKKFKVMDQAELESRRESISISSNDSVIEYKMK